MKLILFFLILASASFARADQVVEVLLLKHLTASDAAEIIQPFLEKEGTVNAADNKLIVKTTRANLTQIKKILRSIDSKPRLLMISVRLNTNGNMDTETTRSTRSRNEDENIIRLQATSGKSAYVDMGKSVPVNEQRNSMFTGVVVKDGIEYKDATSGFYVLPNLVGKNVTLKVSPYMNRVEPRQEGVFDLHSVETTVSGKLGEWIVISESAQNYPDNETISTENSRRENRTIMLKVEELK